MHMERIVEHILAPRVNLRRLGPVARNASNLRDRALNAVVPSRGDEDDQLERLD